MELKNKKIYCLGDSITEANDCLGGRYFEWLEKQTGANCVGLGISGTRIAPQREHTCYADECDYITRLDKIGDDADIIVVFGGTNDFGHGDAPFGKVGDITPDTFCGAAYSLFSSIIAAHPTAVLVAMTPLHRLSEDVTVNEIGIPCKPLFEYVNAIKQVCQSLSVPVLDLWSIAGIQPKIPVIKEKFMPDGLHPNRAGHKLISDRLIGLLNTL